MKPYFRVYSNESTAAEHVETLEQAQARAEELAAKHPGRSFEILRCVGIAQTSKASTFWMDGEHPPEKPRYRVLEKGEIYIAGDEWLDDAGPDGYGIWKKAHPSDTVSGNHKARRPL